MLVLLRLVQRRQHLRLDKRFRLNSRLLQISPRRSSACDGVARPPQSLRHPPMRWRLRRQLPAPEQLPHHLLYQLAQRRLPRPVRREPLRRRSLPRQPRRELRRFPRREPWRWPQRCLARLHRALRRVQELGPRRLARHLQRGIRRQLRRLLVAQPLRHAPQRVQERGPWRLMRHLRPPPGRGCSRRRGLAPPAAAIQARWQRRIKEAAPLCHHRGPLRARNFASTINLVGSLQLTGRWRVRRRKLCGMPCD